MKSKKVEKIVLNPFTLLAGFLVLGLVLVFMMMLAQNIFQKKTVSERVEKSQIQIQDGDRVITVNKNGSVEFKSPKGVFWQNWEKDQVDSFFERRQKAGKDSLGKLENDNYLYTIYFISGDETQVSQAGKEDEEINALFQAFTNNEAQNWLSDFFESTFATITGGETQTSGNASGGNSASGASGGGSTGGSGGGSGRPADCPFWVLSMCIYPRDWFGGGGVASPAPVSPLPSQAGQPKPSKLPVVPDCTLWNQLITGRTVISNTLCVK